MDTLFADDASPAQASLPSNEPAPENQPATSDSVTEKIKRVGAKIFEKYGVTYKRGGGRPRKDGLPNKLDIPLNAPSTAIPAAASVPAPLPAQEGLDPILVKRCCSALLKAVTGFLDKVLHRKAIIVGYSPVDANQLVVNCTITAEELDSFAQLAEVCLRKYGVGSEYLPEIGLACIGIGVGVRYTVALGALEAERKSKLRGQNITELPKQ